jgi:hypothetical protein
MLRLYRIQCYNFRSILSLGYNHTTRELIDAVAEEPF